MLEKKPQEKSTVSDRENAAIKAYLETKLSLCSNLRDHFDSIPGLQEILIEYMHVCQYSIDHATRSQFKIRLIQAGVFNNEQILEFLLLISEKERYFYCTPENTSDEQLCRYYFDQYKSSTERWSLTHFSFWRQHTSSHQKEKNKFLEEIAIEMITRSRAHVARSLDTVPQEVTHFVQKVDSHFREAFFATFGNAPPVSLIKITRITQEKTEQADRISGYTFVNVQHYFTNRNAFAHYLIHEALHLCFIGISQHQIEEGLIEYFVEKMMETLPAKEFLYHPISDQYQIWKENIKALCSALPDIEKKFLAMFLENDVDTLKKYLRNNLTAEIQEVIKNEYYTRNIHTFLNTLIVFAAEN